MNDTILSYVFFHNLNIVKETEIQLRQIQLKYRITTFRPCKMNSIMVLIINEKLKFLFEVHEPEGTSISYRHSPTLIWRVFIARSYYNILIVLIVSQFFKYK